MKATTATARKNEQGLHDFVPQLILKFTGTCTMDSIFCPPRVAGTNDQPRTAFTAAESSELLPDD